MPFIRRSAGTSSTETQRPQEEISSHLAGLSSPDAELRWSAARALGAHADAVPALAAVLGAERIPRVREAIMTALMRVGDEASVRALLPYLRSQDAGERAAAIEALQALPAAILPFMEPLLADGDSDVRILATELARNLPSPDATRLLCRLIEHEPHPNVCAAAVDVLAEVGTREAIPVLEACAERFSATPFLPFAISTAMARIADAKGS